MARDWQERYGVEVVLVETFKAFRTDGLPLGCLSAKLWAREPETETEKIDHHQLSIDEKESGRWVEAYQAANQAARAMPQTHLVMAADREGDIFELFDQAPAAPKNLHYLVRAKHDRLLESGQKLWAELLGGAAGGTFRMAVPRRQHEPARTATLELRWRAIEISPPASGLKEELDLAAALGGDGSGNQSPGRCDGHRMGPVNRLESRFL